MYYIVIVNRITACNEYQSRRTSDLCGMTPTTSPQMMPANTPIAISMGPCIASVSQLPEKTKVTQSNTPK